MRADQWLTLCLCFGPRSASEIIEKADAEGISEDQLRDTHRTVPLVVFDVDGKEFWKLEGVDS